MAFNTKSIRFRLLLLGLGLIIIISIAYVIGYSSITSRIVTNLIYEDTALHIESHKKSIENWLEERANEIEIMANSLSLHSMGEDEIFQFLKDGIDRHSDKYLTLLYADVTGDYMTDLYREAGSIADRLYFPQALEGKTVISNPVKSKSTGQDIIVIATPVRGQDGDVVGVFAGTIDLKNFYRFVEGFIHGEEVNNTYIISGSGTIIAHTDVSLIMDENITRSSQHIDTQLASKSKEILSDREGSIIIGTDKDRRMIAFKEIPNTQGWKIIIEIYINHLLSPIRNMTNLLILFAFAMIVLGSIVFHRISYYQTKPIIELKEAFDKATAGNLMVRAKTHYGYELGEAGKSFNLMMERINKLTYYDPLTSLPNGNAFIEKLNEEAQLSDVAILLLSIEDFRKINDLYGHNIGDSILVELANGYRRHLHGDERVSRINGDEYIFLLKGSDPDEILRRAQDLYRITNRIFMRSGNAILVVAKGGLAFYEQDIEDVQELIKRAELAKAIAKRYDSREVLVYRTEMKDQIQEQLDMTQLLNKALSGKEFIVHYQPILSIHKKSVVGAEALLRWNSPEKGLMPPATFIPILEDTKLINPVGEWLIYEVCRQNKEWQSKGLKPIKISINVSVLQFEGEYFVEIIERVLRETGLAPRYLQLEITESVVMDKTQECLEKLQELNRMGVKISVDDFGTGYSSLRYIKDFPIQNLKIDRSFVQGMLRNKKDHAIVSVIIAIAQALNLTTTAEGVESRKQIDVLREEGCNFVQGFYLSRPMDNIQFEGYLKNGKIQ